jgi:hypothetical protein
MNFARALTYRPFALLWAGQTTLRLGDSLHRIAMIVIGLLHRAIRNLD